MFIVPFFMPMFPPSQQLAYSEVRSVSSVPQGLPVRLKIPGIGVDSIIEDGLITSDGRMDVSEGSVNVSWFALGPKPGEVGSAVIGGHFGISNDVKFVFYDLDKMVVGDEVQVVNDKGEVLTFRVREIKMYTRDADATEVFTSKDGLSHLNVITCEGAWNQKNDTYDDRRVVFTDLVTEGRAATPSTASTDQFPRSLSVGMSGNDVIALQTVLENKGFLTMPLGVKKGHFGPLTKTALAAYQRLASLPPTGYFGPMTRAKMEGR